MVVFINAWMQIQAAVWRCDHLSGDEMEAASPTLGNKLHEACNNITTVDPLIVTVCRDVCVSLGGTNYILSVL